MKLNQLIPSLSREEVAEQPKTSMYAMLHNYDSNTNNGDENE